MLNVNDTVKIDASLEVGGVSETITVEGEAPVVNTATADISKTVEAKQIESLPIVDRNVYSLLDITPGVQSNNNGVASASAGTSNLTLGFPEQRTLINGGADGGTGSVNYYLDGGINMTALRNTGNILPNPDAIQEFKVQTNSYNVEYGRFASGIINVITRSGTNAVPRVGVRVHARRRPERQGVGLDAGAPAAQAEPVPAAPWAARSRRTGRSSSPRYSGLRQTTQTFLNNAIVPTALERTGDFSQSRTIPTDPATGQLFACNGVMGVICREPARPGVDEDHQRLHSAVQRLGRHLAGLRREPVQHRRVVVQARPPAERGAPVVGQLLLHQGRERDPGRQRQPAVGALLVQLDAAQPERERHLGDQHQQDQPAVVLVQPQLRRPPEPAGDVARPISVRRPSSWARRRCRRSP